MHVEKILSKAPLVSSSPFFHPPLLYSCLLFSPPPLFSPLFPPFFFLLSPPSGGPVGYRLHPNHPGVHHGEPHRYLDYSGSQTHEDRDQLLHRQPGLLRRLHGFVQHSLQLCLRASQRLVLWPGLLPISELLPHHSHVFVNLLHGRYRSGQVSRSSLASGAQRPHEV